MSNPPPAASPVPATSPGQPPASQSVTFPIVVRYNQYSGIGLILFGIVLSWFALNRDQFPLGLIFVVIGVLYLFGKVAIVEPNLVSINGPIQITIRKRPINGLADLYFKGDKLYRRSDDRKILNLGWGTSRTDDLRHLKQAVAAAQPPPAPQISPSAQS